MNTLRFNITLPAEMGWKLKKTKNKSAFIAESIREKLQRVEQEKADKKLAEAYKAHSREEKKLLEVWDFTAGDGL